MWHVSRMPYLILSLRLNQLEDMPQPKYGLRKMNTNEINTNNLSGIRVTNLNHFYRTEHRTGWSAVVVVIYLLIAADECGMSQLAHIYHHKQINIQHGLRLDAHAIQCGWLMYCLSLQFCCFDFAARRMKFNLQFHWRDPHTRKRHAIAETNRQTDRLCTASRRSPYNYTFGDPMPATNPFERWIDSFLYCLRS